MPLFEFKCPDCGGTVEVLRPQDKRLDTEIYCECCKVMGNKLVAMDKLPPLLSKTPHVNL